jgi:hypothetical protein
MPSIISMAFFAQPMIANGEAPTPSAVYRCVINEVVTFSDRPCDAGAKHYTPDSEWVSMVDVTKTAASPGRVPSRKPKRAQVTSIAAAQAKHKEECTRLEEALRDVRSRLRAGYDVSQGERLKERNRKLNADLRSKRC